MKRRSLIKAALAGPLAFMAVAKAALPEPFGMKAIQAITDKGKTNFTIPADGKKYWVMVCHPNQIEALKTLDWVPLDN